MATSPHGFQLNHATISASGNGDNTIVAAVAGMSIRVCFLYLVSGGTVTVTWKSSTTTTIGGPTELIAQTGYVLNMNEYGWFQTDQGDLLNCNLSAAIAVGGSLGYFLV